MVRLVLFMSVIAENPQVEHLSCTKYVMIYSPDLYNSQIRKKHPKNDQELKFTFQNIPLLTIFFFLIFFFVFVFNCFIFIFPFIFVLFFKFFNFGSNQFYTGHTLIAVTIVTEVFILSKYSLNK